MTTLSQSSPERQPRTHTPTVQADADAKPRLWRGSMWSAFFIVAVFSTCVGVSFAVGEEDNKPHTAPAADLDAIAMLLTEKIGGTWEKQTEHPVGEFLQLTKLPEGMQDGGGYVLFPFCSHGSDARLHAYRERRSAPFHVLGIGEDCTVLTWGKRDHPLAKAVIGALKLTPATALPGPEIKLPRGFYRRVVEVLEVPPQAGVSVYTYWRRLAESEEMSLIRRERTALDDPKTGSSICERWRHTDKSEIEYERIDCPDRKALEATIEVQLKRWATIATESEKPLAGERSWVWQGRSAHTSSRIMCLKGLRLVNVRISSLSLGKEARLEFVRDVLLQGLAVGAQEAEAKENEAARDEAVDLDQTAKLLTEKVGGEWRVADDRDEEKRYGFRTLSAAIKGKGFYSVLPFPLDRQGRKKASRFAADHNVPHVVVGSNERWTVIHGGSADKSSETDAKLLKALGIPLRTGPEVVNGLSVTLTADKGYPDLTGQPLPGFGAELRGISIIPSAYGSGEPVKINVVYRNHTDREIRIARTDLMATALPVRMAIDKAEIPVSTVEIVVPAGGWHVLWITLKTKHPEAQFSMGDMRNARSHELSPGEHTMRLIVDFGSKLAGKWSGTLRSNEVMFCTRGSGQPDPKGAAIPARDEAVEKERLRGRK